MTSIAFRPLHLAIVAPPLPGHINPLVALGAALQDLGHRVTLVHVAEARELLAEAPIGFEPLECGNIGPDVLQGYVAQLAAATGPIGLNRMIAATAAMTATLLDQLPAALERIGADAVIADSAEPAGVLVARLLGLPVVTSVTGLPLIREPQVPPPFVDWPYLAGPLGRFRNAGGYAVTDLLLAPITRVVEERRRAWGITERAEFSDLMQIAQCPRGLDFPRQDVPRAFRYGAAWRLPEPAIDRPSSDDRPLVFCSLGSLQGGRKALFATMTAACAAVGARAVVAHGGGLNDAEARSLPGDPLVRDYWPQTALLRHCTAAVLHGGFNSVLDALAARIPIVAVPIAFEQPATAARLAYVGAGLRVSPGGLSVARLTTALRRVIDEPAFAQAASRLGDEMAGEGGAGTAAGLVSAALAPSPRAAPAGATTAYRGSDDVRGDSRRNGSR
ncbi:glycosyltransferase [Sphingomonas sp. Tas61C01]|uniref:glycosyltransferase n=1 Tax=Sphingomonas sp. Tas61C01 TaxID=3458297 RepID=UPI00403E63B5